MKGKSNILTSDILKIVLVFLVILCSVLYYFREPIKDHKVTQAKMEMLKRMLKTEPKEWPGEFNEVYDSLIANKKDSSGILKTGR